ncbi:MAG: cytochrome c biogenesis protein ResB [Acidobacteria bacterium]|nr:cytochrome c biogenesis protein ResB [Acidobacteriota bacterium]
MTRTIWAPLRKFLRSPATIVGELGLITILGGLGAALPQAGVAPQAELDRLRSHGAFLTGLVDVLSLDHVFTSPAFLGVLALAFLSLSIVVLEQWRRLRSQWSLAPSEAAFRNAPHRIVFTRAPEGPEGDSVDIRTTGRLAQAGSPLFHTGLLCVVLAGVLRALFGAGALVDVYEGEVLPAGVEAWGAQWPGPLGRPFQLDEPLLLQAVETRAYPSGALLDLRLKLAPPGPGGGPVRELGVNEDLPLRRGRLYVGSEHGPTALLEWSGPGTPAQRSALLLERKEKEAFGAYGHGPSGLVARVRAPRPGDGSRPGLAEVRVLQGDRVLGEAALRPGEAMALPDGASLALHGLPTWVRLHGAYDPALPLAYLGFALAILGATLIFAIVRVDELVATRTENGACRVEVALRPARFAPLYRDRFERLVRHHGGTP